MIKELDACGNKVTNSVYIQHGICGYDVSKVNFLK